MIQTCSMAFQLDPIKNKLVYLYQLKKERCTNSFGINVAQIAGLPQLILSRAQYKSEELHERLVDVYQRYLEKRYQVKHE
jgi:DNA mismatch repair ATPase MutS